MSVKKLFEPTRIGKMRLKNRIVFPPIHSTFVSETGAVTDRLTDYLVARAKGGVSMITVEDSVVDYPQKDAPTELRLDSDDFIYGLGDLADAIHEHDVKVAINPQHPGRQTQLSNTNGVQLVAPSAVPSPGAPIPRALTIDEILEIEDRFALAAERAMRVGFDAIELHAAHGYLFTQFMSPRTNMRGDLYGGSLENRTRFSVETVTKIKKKVGQDFPLIFRFSAEEGLEGGFTIDDSRKVVPWLENAGVDAFHVSAGTYESLDLAMSCYDMPHGLNVHLAGEIKKIASVPVITVGRLDPYTAAKAIEDQKADIVAIGRPLIADPEWPKKVFEDRIDDIRPCIYCNKGCFGRDFNYQRESCTVNIEHGREQELKIRPADKRKKVVIVGGGPAGMEAARVTALRGHDTTLIEKGDKLGGQLIAASTPFFKQDYRKLLEYYAKQLKDLAVHMELKKEADADLVEKLKPDAVIVATGSESYMPRIPGVDLPNVATAEEVILGYKNVGEKVVVIGGGLPGCDVAWFLSAKGKRVTVVGRKQQIATTLNPICRKRLFKAFEETGVKTITNSIVTRISEKTVTIMDILTGRERNIEAETTIVAMGRKSTGKIFNDLSGRAKEIYRAGDCVEVRDLRIAIQEGSIKGRKV